MHITFLQRIAQNYKNTLKKDKNKGMHKIHVSGEANIEIYKITVYKCIVICVLVDKSQ